MDGKGIETYPVGIYRDLIRMWLRFRNPLRSNYTGWRAIRIFWGWFKISYKRRTYWNGYLAEWHYIPDGVNCTKAGRGWTRRAAVRDLMKHIYEENKYHGRA